MATGKKGRTASKKSPAKTTKTNQNKNKTQQEMLEKSGKYQLWAIVLFVIGIFLLCVAMIEGQNIWKAMHDCMYGLFGAPAFFLPVSVIYIAVMYTLEKSIGGVKHKLWQAAVLVCLICSAMQMFMVGEVRESGFVEIVNGFYSSGTQLVGGGVVGALISWPLMTAFGKTGAEIIVVLLIFLFLMLLTGSTLIGLFRAVSKPYKKISDSYTKKVAENNAARFNIDVDLGPDGEQMPAHPVYSEDEYIRRKIDIPLTEEEENEKFNKKDKASSGRKLRKILSGKNDPLEQTDLDADKNQPVKSSAVDDIIKKASAFNQPESSSAIDIPIGDDAVDDFDENIFSKDENNQTKMFDGEEVSTYIAPPVSLLKKSVNNQSRDISAELKHNSEKLVDVLKSFKVYTHLVDVCRGPTVTRYELQPSSGVKISKITGLADDIALNLAAAGVRIEAPIPGKSAVGVEIPNKVKDVVNIRDIIESETFEKSKSKLTVALGKDIGNNDRVADLAKMPHLLIAGTTGSGKSVCVNSFLISLLYKSSPDEVKLVLIDPKMVEFSVYNGIPHLLIPVVSDPRKAAGALNWAVTEMEKRYKTFADNGVRDIQGFNEMARANPEIKSMPQIVIAIDELADLMMVASNEVETAICRLAQKARAAGMHLVIATQRPSVDVITGLIKANIPSRIALTVSSYIDSKTILDAAGAEKLLGYGDMLYYPIGYPKPVRIQGCYVSDKERDSVIEFIKEQQKQKVTYDEEIIEEIEKQSVQEKNSDSDSENMNGRDEMVPEAIECIMESGQASTSFLQRKLRVGYARAGRLMDDLEDMGIVGPSEGSKPRKILITRQQYIEMTMNKSENDS